MRLILALVIILSSCSFKKKDEFSTFKKLAIDPTQLDPLDCDGDGVQDAEELTSGTEACIADIPTFSGDMFEEMSVVIKFYNKNQGSYETIDWKTKDGISKYSWEEVDRTSKKGGLYLESLVENSAANTDYKRNNFKFSEYTDSLLAYASPQIFEDGLLSISDKIMSFQRNGYEINRAEVTVLSQFKISSNKYETLRNPVFDLYYKSQDQDKLVIIESKGIDGTYSFNEDTKVNIHFDSFETEIIEKAFLSGGAKFFIKLRDFTIYETNENYSSIIQKVRLHSVPVMISQTAAEGTPETLYVGTSGNAYPLSYILQKAFKDDILMTPISVDKLRGLSNRIQSHEDTGLNETFKWYVASSYKEENIYSHLFKPGEGIGLAYISDKKVEKRPFYVSRAILDSTQSSVKSGNLPIETKDIKITFVPKKFLVPVEKYESVVLPNCPQGNWEINEVSYNKATEGWEERKDQFALALQVDGYISIKTENTIILEGNISALINEQLLIATKAINNGFSLSLSPKVAQQLQKDRSHTTVQISLKPSSITLNIGELTEVGRLCKEVTEGCDCAGHGGANGGNTKKTRAIHRESLVEATGVSSVDLQNQYDLDIHLFAY